MELKELSTLLKEHGIVGAGGAGFPTYAKMDQRAETIILNCAECEPLLRLHRQLLEQHAPEILEMLGIIQKAVGAKEAIIGIKHAYHNTIEAVEQYIDQYEGMKIGLLDEVYPAGDEVVLIYELTGKIIRPGGLPIESNVAVFNVETVYNGWRAMKSGEPVTDKLVSVVGEVEHPMTVRVPLGCTVEETVRHAGKVTTEEPVYFIGGPMMGFIGNGYMPITKTTNAILVLPKQHLIIQKKQSKSSIEIKRAAASCCQCTMCTDLCPRNRLGHPVEPHLFMRAATCKDLQDSSAFTNTMFCSSCGLCEMYSCMQGLSPRTLMTEYKAGLRSGGIKPPANPPIKPVGEERSYRKVPMERLMARLGLTQYDKEAPLHNEVVKVKKVKITMSQHIGSAAVPMVAVGDCVVKGQMIGRPGSGLSVAIHASISGKVLEVTEKYVIIERV